MQSRRKLPSLSDVYNWVVGGGASQAERVHRIRLEVYRELGLGASSSVLSVLNLKRKYK